MTFGRQATASAPSPRARGITDEVLFGQVWARDALSSRDRSLVTVTTLVAGLRTKDTPFLRKKALENGVAKPELIEVITSPATRETSGWAQRIGGER